MIDWPTTIREIQKHMPLEKAAVHMGLNKGYFHSFLRQKIVEPGHSTGVKILALRDKLKGE